MSIEETETLYADAILGIEPRWNMIGDLEKRELGQWTGGFVDQWTWNSTAVRKLPVEEQKALYQRIKESWRS